MNYTHIEFKYISCSYLSSDWIPCSERLPKFKYISCSYLSQIQMEEEQKTHYLNTSHVLIYLKCSIQVQAVSVI